LIKTACLRARQLGITVSFYSLARDSRPIYCAREDSRSRTRKVESGHLVFRKGTVYKRMSYDISNRVV